MHDTPHPLSLIMADPGFQGLDPICRGFHATLLAAACHKKPGVPLGAISGHDPSLRKLLGIPLRRELGNAGDPPLLAAMLAQTGDERHPDGFSSAGAWIDHQWRNTWKPALMECWTVIDEAAAEENPAFRRHIGYWFHPLPAMITSATPATTRTDSPEMVATDEDGEKAARILNPEPDWSVWANPETVIRAWNSLESARQKRDMWKNGASLIARAETPAEMGRARGIIGKWVGQYGEIPVAHALIELNRKNPAPADPVAFVSKLLSGAGTKAGKVEAARKQRSGVAI